MDRIIYTPKTFINKNGEEQTIVCVERFEIIVEDNKVVIAFLKGGCKGGSQTIIRTAQAIGDIDKIIKAIGGIICAGSHEKKSSCAQQFAYVLYMYLLKQNGMKLPEEDAQRLIIENNVSKSEIMEKVKRKEKTYSKTNNFNKF